MFPSSTRLCRTPAPPSASAQAARAGKQTPEVTLRRRKTRILEVASLCENPTTATTPILPWTSGPLEPMGHLLRLLCRLGPRQHLCALPAWWQDAGPRQPGSWEACEVPRPMASGNPAALAPSGSSRQPEGENWLPNAAQAEPPSPSSLPTLRASPQST